jgi:hypothetical protein
MPNDTTGPSVKIDLNVECENGHIYRISRKAYDALKIATNGREANDAFEGFASHVPCADRGQLWQSI